MSYSFRPLSEVEGVGRIKLGIAGPSRSGKTYSAIRVAIGLAGGRQENVFLIDTEKTSGIYKARFPGVRTAYLEPPYTYARYQEAIEAATEVGAKVIIVDSLSHGHEGPGGLIEQHEAEMTKMAGTDYAKRERIKFAAWIRPKAAFTQFCIKQAMAGPHMVFCFRAKEKLKLVRNNGKQEPVPMGWQPICTEGIEFEMTVMFVLPPNSSGKPDFAAEAAGLRDPIDKMVRPGMQFDEAFGKALADWAGSTNAPAPVVSRETAVAGIPASEAVDPESAGKAAAMRGSAALRQWWSGEGKTHQATLGRDGLARLKAVAAEADAKPKEPDIQFDEPDRGPDADLVSHQVAGPQATDTDQPSSGLNESRRDEILKKIAKAPDAYEVDKVVKQNGAVLRMLNEQAPRLYDEVMDAATKARGQP